MIRLLLPLLPAALLASPLGAAPHADPDRMGAIVRTLASPAFEGRAPGTPGEARTVDYLIAQLRALGLEPAGDRGGYAQAVPLVRTRVTPDLRLVVTLPGGAMPLVQAHDAYVGTVRPDPRLAIARAPLVFVGYGVSAPERGWDDFKGVDLRGKIAVFLVNDPDFAAAPGEAVAGRFGGRRMTYYGRWTYKFEEAARRGALGALIVHDAAAAGYGWETVVAPGGENYDIVRGPEDRRVALQGWLAADAAAELFRRAGLDLGTLSIAARRADFRPVPLPGVTLDATGSVAVARVESRNLLARIPGTAHPDETVLIGAHWDAYGIGAPDAAGRTIRAGADDDGTGVAAVLETARLFKAGPAPERTLLFALWTGEERGLLGSESWAAHPPVALGRMAAAVAFDILQTAGPSRDVVLVGDGQSDLDDRLAAAAVGQGRRVTPEALPERGLFFRADHFSVARRGVPSLLLMAMSGGYDLVAGGRAAGDAWLAGYMKCYHQPCDLWSPGWDLRGAAADVDLVHDVVAGIAGGHDWPAWRAGSEFAGQRAASAAERR